LAMKKNINILSYLLFFLILSFIYQKWFIASQTMDLKYSDFLLQLETGNVSSVVIKQDMILGDFKNPVDSKTQFKTIPVEEDLAQKLSQHQIEFRQQESNKFVSDFLPIIISSLLFFGLWMFLMRRIGKSLSTGPGGGFVSVGRSKAKIYLQTDTKTTFKDVAGADEAIEELKEIIEFLKNNQQVKNLGAKMPKGVLLVGPPGTGKTLIAKALAGEAGVPFFSTNGAEFVEMFVGVGAARVRDLFEQAKKQAPCIIFIDELDALGRARAALGPIGGNDEKEQTLNQLLVEMDGFDAQSGIIILAATNRPEILDPALLRSGRFDRQVLIDRPDKKGREAILKIHTQNILLSPQIDLSQVAAMTVGFTGADLANLVNEATLMATRDESKLVEMDHFTRGLERILTGLEKKNRILNEKERRVVAYHEMGHAIVGSLLSKDETVHKVSIIPRGIGSLGYTIQRPTEDRYLMAQSELKNKMSVLLSGRAAEKIIFQEFSTGAADDLARATSIAREMVLRYGMSEELGPISWDDGAPQFLGQVSPNNTAFSEEISRIIDKNIQSLLQESYQRANLILEKNKQLLHRCAEALLVKETLNEDELATFFKEIQSC
jgi:cell division protease FtsH